MILDCEWSVKCIDFIIIFSIEALIFNFSIFSGGKVNLVDTLTGDKNKLIFLIIGKNENFTYDQISIELIF